MTLATAKPKAGPSTDDATQIRRVTKEIEKRSFLTLATTSPKGRPHAAGVIYETVDGALYVHTMRGSRKGRNIAANGYVGVVIPARKIPVGPPFNIQFQATAEILDMDDPRIVALLEDGKLKSIAGHGALEEPDGSFLKITPTGRIHSYGIGVSLLGVIRDPLHAGARSVELA
jgi:hypothetical protein